MRTSAEVRDRLVKRLDFSLAHPSLVTVTRALDGYFWTLLGDLAFIDGSESDLQRAFEVVLENRDVWGSFGTETTVGGLMPRRVVAQVRASIWAEVAHRCALVNVSGERIRHPEAWEDAVLSLLSAINGNLTGRDVVGLAGEASIGGKSWLGFVDEGGRWFHVYLARWQEPGDAQPHGGYVDSGEAMVVALRIPADTFAEGLMLTPFGAEGVP